MSEQLDDQQKAALAAEDKRARAWVKIQQEEAAKLAEERRAASANTMSAVEFESWSREQIARGDASKREAAQRTEFELRERGAKIRAGANG